MAKLGELVQDMVTGFKGTATGRIEYLGGETQVRIEALKDGEVKQEWFPEGRIASAEEDDSVPVADPSAASAVPAATTAPAAAPAADQAPAQVPASTTPAVDQAAAPAPAAPAPDASAAAATTPVAQA